MISINFSYFSDTIAYKKRGSIMDNPNGYSPDPITLMDLSISAVSLPSKGIYKYEPKISSFGCDISRNGRVTFYITVMKP
jgi:hypothetical protein